MSFIYNSRGRDLLLVLFAAGVSVDAPHHALTISTKEGDPATWRTYPRVAVGASEILWF